jgi:AcrR family transcriptional regulator
VKGKRMNAREKVKQETRNKILQLAKEEYIDKGLLGLSTVTIAKKANIAHGTVFFHFPTKDDLMMDMLDIELLKITAELNPLLTDVSNMRILMERYLDFVASEEPFLSMLAKEAPLYTPQMRRTVMGREAAIRHYFHIVLTREMVSGHCKSLDSTLVLTFLFSTIQEFLRFRDAYRTGESVIKERKEIIIDTFMDFISTNNE